VAVLAVGTLLFSSGNWALADWPQFRYGPEGTGFNPLESTISASNVSGLQQRWTETSVVPSLESSPVVVNGVLYANSTNGKLDAFDATNGTAKWSYSICTSPCGATSGPGDYVTGPAVANGVVYYAADHVYAIDATSGIKLWSSGGAIEGPISLVTGNGGVYVTDALGQLWAFDATTGAQLWYKNVGNGHAIIGSLFPAVANGVVYVNPAGYSMPFAFNAATGVFLWGPSSPDPNVGGGGSPAIANGVVYAGGGEGKLDAFDATTGAPLWSEPSGSQCACDSTESPAVANGVVYSSADDGTLSAFNATTGAPLWSTATGNAIPESSPVVANGVVYVGGGDGKLDAFSASTGTKLWSSPTAGRAFVAPVVDNGVVYASSNGPTANIGHLEAYGPPVSGAALTVSPTFVPEYGALLDGTSSPPTRITVTNFGSSATTALTDTITGADAAEFHIASDTCAGTVLAGGASCTIGVVFAPTVPGVFLDTLTVSAGTDDSAGATLSGTGNALTINPTSWDYGTVTVGTSSHPKAFTVTNHSSITVSPSVGSLAGSQFTARSDNCRGATLAPGATCTIAVVFRPRGGIFGSTSATLSVSSAPGVITSATLSGASSPIAIVPASKNYGTVPVGSTSTATFTITNVSSSVAFFGLPSVTGSGFSITSDNCPISRFGQYLNPGASCTKVVTFAPSVTATTYHGQLTVSVISPGSATSEARLVGRGG
jgi:outer membrane protein assembly factor BamB